MKKKKIRPILIPLTRQFTIILTIFTICTIIITAISAADYVRIQTEILNSSLESYSSQLTKKTREAYVTYENICYSIAYSQGVQDFLMSSSTQETYENYQQIENQLSIASLLSPYIVDIAVYGKNDTFASLYGSSLTYKKFADSLSGSRFSYHSAGIATINNIPCHILAMPSYSLGTGKSQYLGILFLAVDIDNLLSNTLSTNNTYDPEIVFTDSAQQFVYGNKTLYQSIMNTDGIAETSEIMEVVSTEAPTVTYFVKSYSIPEINHTLYVLIDKSETTIQTLKISFQLIASIVVLLILIFLLLLMLYRPLIRSLKQLTDFMNNISAGDRRAFKEGTVIDQGLVGSSEIQDISTAFNDMLKETDRLNHTIFNTYTRMYELEANNRKTEIAFLRSQINPHFLYNTLTMICGLAAEGMNDKIISVTGALSQIFRYSIKGNDTVTLREEMEIVRSYLTIQEERFSDRFSVRYVISDISYDCMIPKMIIQPLVENAIVHGLEKSLKHGELLIGADRDPKRGYLAIWIYDTGVGMPQSKLEELRSSIASSSQPRSGDAMTNLAEMDAQNHDSIGILNVNSRMVLYYGSDYTLLIDSEEGVGTNIQLRIPYRTA